MGSLRFSFFFLFFVEPAAQFPHLLATQWESGGIPFGYHLRCQGRRSLGASHPLKIADNTLVIEVFSRLRFVTRVGPPKRLPLAPSNGNRKESPCSLAATEDLCSSERAGHEGKDGSGKGSRAEGPVGLKNATKRDCP